MLNKQNIEEKINEKMISFGDDYLSKLKYDIDININENVFFKIVSFKKMLLLDSYNKICNDWKHHDGDLEKINLILNGR
jgi:hypothetical protein